MGYKEQEWFRLNRSGIKFELIVRDQDFKKIEIKRFTLHDFTKTIKDVGNRYGVSRKEMVLDKEIKEEIDWLREKKII